ncbi:MAG: hypothetical protein AB1Z51_07935 [Desulfuromonadales bacterium]
MKTILKITVLAISLVMLFIADVPFLTEQLVPEAEAIFGVRRRALRRGVIIGSTVAASEAAAVSHQQPAPAQQQAAPAPQPPPSPAPTGKPLPLGTVVSALPAGCTSTPVSGVEYYYCGGNFYRAVFQGNKLVYVTAKPE